MLGKSTKHGRTIFLFGIFYNYFKIPENTLVISRKWFNFKMDMVDWYVFSKKMVFWQKKLGLFTPRSWFHIDLPIESHTEDSLVVMGNSMLPGV